MRTSSLFFIVLFLIISSCTKQVAGPKGDPGKDAGKGNLKKSERTITVTPASWSFNGGQYTTTLFIPEITNEVITKGEIKVYMKVGAAWWSLPYAVGDIFMEQTSETGKLHLEYSKIHDGPPPAPVQTDFRIVAFAPAN